MGGISNTGNKKTKAHKKNLSESLQGVPLGKERKQNISNSMIGNTNSKNHSSDEYKEKQRVVMRQAWARRKAKQL